MASAAPSSSGFDRVGEGTGAGSGRRLAAWIVLSGLAAAGAFVVRGVFLERERDVLERRVDEAVVRARDAVAERIAVHERILARMAERIPQLDGPSSDAWHLESSQLLRDEEALETLLSIDASGKVLWAVPAPAAAALAGRDMGPIAAATGAWTAPARDVDHLVVAGALPSGAPGLWCLEPLVRSPAVPPTGWLLGGFDARKLLGGPVARSARECRVTLGERGTVVYRTPRAGGDEPTSLTRETDVPGTRLRMRLDPTPTFVASSHDVLPDVVLAGGIALAVFGALAAVGSARAARFASVTRDARAEALVERRERLRAEARLRAREKEAEAAHARLRRRHERTESLHRRAFREASVSLATARERIGSARTEPTTHAQAALLGAATDALDLAGRVLGHAADLVRIEDDTLALDVRDVAIEPLLRGAVAALESKARARDASAVVHGADPRIASHVDAVRVAQVLSALVGHAVGAVSPGGRVVVSAKPVDDTVEVGVSWSGGGDAPDRLERLLAGGYDVDPSDLDAGRRGGGLGLHLARELVGRLGGRLWATGDASTTAFVFTLPAARALPDERLPASLLVPRADEVLALPAETESPPSAA